MYTTFLSAVVFSGNHGLSAVSTLEGRTYYFDVDWFVGSGSTYVYGYCDATYKDGWGRDETVEFVKNSTYMLHSLNHSLLKVDRSFVTGHVSRWFFRRCDPYVRYHRRGRPTTLRPGQ